MSEEVASAFVEKRAFEAALAETEQHRAANAALQSQLAASHEVLLLAEQRISELQYAASLTRRDGDEALFACRVDMETIVRAIRAYLHARPGSEESIALKVELRTLARTAHPGRTLADEVAAARAREAGLKLAADQYSESRDQWMLKAKAATLRGAADHAVAEAARALRAAVQPLGSMARLSEACAVFDAAVAVADTAGTE